MLFVRRNEGHDWLVAGLGWWKFQLGVVVAAITKFGSEGGLRAHRGAHAADPRKIAEGGFEPLAVEAPSHFSVIQIYCASHDISGVPHFS